MTLLLLVLLVLPAGPVAAQQTHIDAFRERVRDVPGLPVDRVQLEVNSSVRLERISAVSADAQGNLYVLHRPTTGDPVVVLDPTGHFLRSWGEGMYAIPHGIRVDPGGHVWTVDSNTSKVYEFSALGEILREIQVAVPTEGAEFCGATDIAFGGDDHVFVADGYCNGRVIEFDASGRQIREWGSRGTGPNQFVVPHGVAVGPDGALYVGDRENGRLQRFTQTGQFLGLWTYAGQLFSVAFSPTRDLYISVSLGGDPEEAYVIQIDPATGEMIGKVEAFGHELAFSPDGSLIPSTVENELILFRPRG
ncbi:MAG: hypothetical protein FJ207_08165 [Gemmatimonadetes bacterium]|nr:hypothetical protein [Gemmatimonadota bacterium]